MNFFIFNRKTLSLKLERQECVSRCYCTERHERERARIQDYDKSNKENRKDYNLNYNIRNKEHKREGWREYYKLQVDSKKKYNRNYYIRKKIATRCCSNYSPRDVHSWKSREEVRSFFDAIAPGLGVSKFSDWYRIARFQIDDQGGICLDCIFLN